MTTEPKTTRQELAGAFSELRKRGYGARMNYLCCGSCASYALAQDGFTKAVFWHGQGDEAFDHPRGRTYCGRTGHLFSTLYIHWTGDRDEIAAVLQKHVTTATVEVPDNDQTTFMVHPKP